MALKKRFIIKMTNFDFNPSKSKIIMPLVFHKIVDGDAVDWEDVDKEDFKKILDNVGKNYQESIQYPSLNIRGLSSGWVKKEVRTIVPDKAIAEIDIRLVKESDPKKLIDLVKNHIIKEGAYIIENRDPTNEERNTK